MKKGALGDDARRLQRRGWRAVRAGLMARTFLLAGFLPLTAPAAGGIELGLPLACTPGQDCWVVRYVDHAPGSGFADYACGHLGADGHDGTDFALRDARAMDRGVAVQAAAAGIVRAMRDGVPDQPRDGKIVFDVEDRQCGNGVLIDHPDGWQSQYCHLHPGSLTVRPGQRVLAGQRLGLVGMSGEANFPHVHLTLRHDGLPIDPFDGRPLNAPCGMPGQPLWQESLQRQLTYLRVPIVSVGLADHVPSHGEIVSGEAAGGGLAPDRPLVAYMLAYGLMAGDRVTLEIDGPDGSRIALLDEPLDAGSARVTRSGGKRAPPAGWPLGRYRVRATVSRGEAGWSLDGSRTLHER